MLPGREAGQLARLAGTRYDKSYASFRLILFFRGNGLARLESWEWAREQPLAGAEPSPLAAGFSL
jgi:hypothetical protein